MKKHFFFLILSVVLVFPKTLSAQGYLESLVQDAIDEAVDEFKTSLWGSILDSEAQSEVKSKAKKLSEFPIDRSSKDEIQKSLGRYDLNGQYSNVYNKLYGHVENCFNNMHDISFAELGKGTLPISMGIYRGTMLQSIEINKLSDVLSKETLDSLSIIDNDGKLSQLLLKDLKDYRSLVGVFNNHPELLRTYKQLSNTDLRTQASQIVYWGQTLKHFNNMIPPKSRKKTINPDLLTFVQNSSSTDVYLKDELVGRLKGNAVTCFHPDLANMVPLPNAEYRFHNIIFKTDKLGRVIYVGGYISSKSSSNLKPSMNPKVLEPLKSSDDLVMSVSPALEGFDIPYCYLNMAYFKKTDSNREAQKRLKHQIKEMKKQGVESIKLFSIIEYEDDDLKCSKLTTILGDNEACVFKNNQTEQEEIEQKQEKIQQKQEREQQKQKQRRREKENLKKSVPSTRTVGFMMANAAYSITPQTSFGLTIGSTKKFGCYVSLNGNYRGYVNIVNFMKTLEFEKADYECDNTGTISGLPSEYSFSGNKSTSRIGATAGMVFRISDPVYAYVGGGYGLRDVFWELENGKWAKCVDDSYQGAAMDAGLMVNFGNFGLSLGAQTIGIKYLETKIGVGFTF